MQEVKEFGFGIASGEIAVLTSSLVNTGVLSKFGLWYMAGISAPIIEELTKTGYAELSNGNVLISHVSFGATEGFLYAKDSKTITRFDHRRPLLHASFGTLYLMGRRLGGSKAAGLLTSILAHFVWNQIALVNAKRSGLLDEVLKETKPRLEAQAVGEDRVLALTIMSLGGEEPEPKPVTYEDVKRAILI